MGLRRSGNFTLRVNPILCDGYGHCAELAPDLITVDEWGYPLIDDSPRDGDDAALASARLAVRGCPRNALALSHERST